MKSMYPKKNKKHKKFIFKSKIIFVYLQIYSINSTDRPSKSKKKPNKSSEDSGQAKSTKNKKRQKNDSENANLQSNQASSQPLVNQMSQFVQQNPQIMDPSKLNVNLNHRPLTTNSATKINEILMINSQNQQNQQQHQQSLTQNFHQLNSNSNVFIIPSTNQFNLQEAQSANVNKLPYREDNLKKILSIPGNELVINEAPMQNQNFNIHDLKNNIMVKNLLVSPNEQQQMSQQQPQSNSMQAISQNNNLKYLQLDGQIDEFDQPKGQPQMSASSHMVNSGENGQNFHKQESHFSSKLSNKVVINHELLNSYGITYNPTTQSSTYSQSSQDAQNFAIMNQSYVNKSDNTLLKQLLNTAPKNAVPEPKPEIKTENIPPSTQAANSEKVKKPKNEKPRSQKPKQQNKLLSDLKNKIESNISEDDNPRKRKNTKANQEMSNETLINRILDELKSFGLLSMCQPKIDHNDEIYQHVSLPEKDHLLKFRHYNLNHFGNMYNLKISIEPRQFKENILEDIENKITTYNKKTVQQSVKICSANLTRPPSVDTNRELMTDSSNRLHRLLESEATSEKMFDEDSNMTDYSGQVLLREPSSPRIDLQPNEIKKEATEPTLSGDMVKTTFKLSQKAGLNFKETVEKLSEILNIDMPGVVHLGKIVKYESKLDENLKPNTTQETMHTMQSLSSTKFSTCSFCEAFLNEEKENIDDIGHTVPTRSECVPKKEKRLLRWSRDLLKNMTKNDNGMQSEKFELLKANGYADSRTCVFCKQSGDLEQNGPCRLLSLDVDKWSHLNCALWSDEVYETMNGALINVELAYKKSLNLQCCYCHEKGASLRCFSPKCNCFYHFPCAVKDKCAFNQDKTIYCSTHSCKALNENRLGDLSVKRSVWIQRDEVAQIQSFMIRDFDESAYAIRIGSLVLHNIGQLLPHQLSTGLFNNRDYIYPVGYRATRIYWSTKSCFKRCQYLCSIEEVDGRPEFSVTITEESGDREIIVDKSPSDLWKRILERVELMRKHLDLVKLFPNYFSGEYMYGLAEPHVIRLVESLPGVETLTNYAFKFGKLQLLDMPLAINPTGSARSEPKLRTHFRKSRTLTCPTTVPNPVQRSESNASASGLNSNGLNLNQAADNVYDRVQDLSEDDDFVKMGADLDNNGMVAYSKQFVQSKSSQFRKLKAEWRQNVYLKKSKIQGLGLFAARDLEKNTMIIEYIGELIRNEVANRREKLYESQNRGIYMFRLNDELVVDATISGGLARYINHCCDPNCVAETVSVEKDQKIIIIANKKILKGEELTYDYQFEFEDESSKIQCLCGSANCKKWMN
ncbi:Histone-lysine N-methyltransferase trr [Brachionus plicatilis]|uniref:Histone-lysine N-methyltransferase trr n=1 Tax=Brachionus plicatilis TaxID=10195 RepID=A0A3M7SXH8_BRAPC|nr:Histone-lysine N-methyltransferase trr [Brachionus plicatilis]